MRDNGRIRLSLNLSASEEQLGRGFLTLAALACTIRQLSWAHDRVVLVSVDVVRLFQLLGL